MSQNDSFTAVRRKFEELGSRIKIREAHGRSRDNFSLDVKSDREGEFFELEVNRPDVEFSVVNIRPKDRHLLLMARVPGETPRDEVKSKFLCGHDERHWFVAGVGNKSTSVENAKESLKPRAVQERQDHVHVKPKERNLRRNPGFIRQGEWFFIPEPKFSPNPMTILANEPLRRGRNKPHMAEFLCRVGGTTVYVSRQYPNGVTENEYNRLLREDPNARRMIWSVMTRNPTAYVKGRVKHPDHKTILLPFWHRVALNGEVSSKHVVFLD